MNLKEYEQTKFAIAGILRSAFGDLPADAYDLRERARGLFSRLAEDRFNLVVVGRFNRGKTSLMNAIIGTNRLPIGVIPLTSVINAVSYGTTERVILKFRDRILTQEVPIDSIHQYVTQEGNPGNVRGITVAETQLRAEILRRGFYFVDTPGMGSAIVENTRTTEAFLPEADAFLVVTSYESPISEEESTFLCKAASSSRRIFLVVNKQDTISTDDGKTILAYVHDELRKIFGEPTPEIFSVSASEGIQAKLFQDDRRLTLSGIPALEEALIEFLIGEKQSQFLIQMCGRVADFITDVPHPHANQELANSISRLGIALRRHDPLDAANGKSIVPDASYLPDLQQLQPCEICVKASQALWNFAATYQYEISTNHDERRRFAENGGLCSFHTWQYHAIASSYGTCNAYPPLLDNWAERLRRHDETGRQHAPDHKAPPPLPSATHCAFCAVRKASEATAISDLAKRLSQNCESTLRSLSAICIPHLRLLAEVVKDHNVIIQLRTQTATVLEHLAEDMRRFSLKRDSLRTLETKEEITAAERTLQLIAGHPNVTPSDPSMTNRVGATTDRKI